MTRSASRTHGKVGCGVVPPVGNVLEPEAVAAVYRAHVGVVHRYLSVRVGAQVGEELTAQTFVEAWARRRSYDPERGTEVAWIMGIAANVLRHHLRQERRRARAHLASAARERVLELADTLEDEVADGVTARERCSALRVALAELSRPDRQVLLLASQPDVSYAAMAELLDVPVGTVRSRLSRARQRLAVHMAAATRT